MRKVFSVALMAAAICLVGIAKDASAAVSFSIVWVGNTGGGPLGGSSTTAVAGNILTMEIRMTNTETLGGHGVSLNYDTNLSNELNFVGGAEWSGTTYGAGTMVSNYSSIVVGLGPPPPVESTAVLAGRVNTYESGVITGPTFLPLGTYVIGTARFVANGAGVSLLELGLFNIGVDEVLNSNYLAFGTTPAATYGSGQVNVIPEPGTASLLGLGLVGLILAGRRSRRS